MNYSTTGSAETNDDNTTLGQCSSYQEMSDLIEFESVKLEPYYPEPNYPSLELVIKEEAEVSKQDDEPMILLSASGEQRTSIKIESDDLGVWEDEPIDFDSTGTGSSVPRKSNNEIQNRMGKMCETYVNSVDPLMFHTERKPNKCNVCAKTFALKKYLNTHMRIHTEKKPHKCNICGKAFMRKSDMKHHMMIHTREKPYKCDDCGKAFAQKNYIRKHMKIHVEEKFHECNICGRPFLRKSEMENHITIHTREKPYKCNDCGKGFIAKRMIKRHILIHIGEKPHKCNVCGKASPRKSDIKRHIMIHTGEKPHECNICGKAFRQKTTMKNHMMIHSREKSVSLKHRMSIHSSVISAE